MRTTQACLKFEKLQSCIERYVVSKFEEHCDKTDQTSFYRRKFFQIWNFLSTSEIEFTSRITKTFLQNVSLKNYTKRQ
ncbi:hypothetical protein LEP1GSC190_02645 [Leptospira mayottensis 200901116]|nr:hypothetical protein LEP1GSC190_02645 [Leptospira mayottensis 200901116]